MDNIDFRHAGADALVEMFINKARLVPHSSNADLQPHHYTPERAALVADIKAIAAELLARKTIDHARALMDNEDRNVRAWAATQLTNADPEWSNAAQRSMWEKASTKEIVDYRARARRPSPDLLGLEEMSVEELVACFEDAALRQYGVELMELDDKEFRLERNEFIECEALRIFEELTTRGARAALLPFLEHANPCVRVLAADHLLVVAPDAATAVLEKIAKGTGAGTVLALAKLHRHKIGRVLNIQFANMKRDELIEQFIEMAVQLGSAVDQSDCWPGWAATRDELYTLAREMMARISVPRLIRLMGHPSPYVRDWAIDRFASPFREGRR